MDKRERVQASLQGEAVDRIPLCLWRHFFCEDRTARDLATATVAFAHAHDLDLVKLTPCGLYAVEDWARERITYPGNDYDPPYLRTPAVTNPAGWQRLSALDPTAGALGRESEAVRLVADGLGGRTPLIMTVFSPLTLAYKLAGDLVFAHMQQYSADLHAGLEIITEATARFARACLEAGADGVFFATQLASHRWLSPAEYAAFGEPYDLGVLDRVASRSTITVLHLHGRDILFDLAGRYPIHAISWHDQETWPGLRQARERTPRAFITGLDRELLASGPPAAIREQVREAVEQTGARGLILAPSCVIPTHAPQEHLQAVRDAVADFGLS